MKNIFNTTRRKVNSMWPYIVQIDVHTYHLFEANRKTSLRILIRIQKAFANNNLIFATIDPKFPNYSFMKDAAKTYIPGEKFPIYFYDGSVFYEIEEVPINDGYGYINLVLTERIAPIQIVQNANLRNDLTT